MIRPLVKATDLLNPSKWRTLTDDLGFDEAFLKELVAQMDPATELVSFEAIVALKIIILHDKLLNEMLSDKAVATAAHPELARTLQQLYLFKRAARSPDFGKPLPVFGKN